MDSPANLAGTSKLRSSSSLVCRCGNRVSDFQAWRFVPGVICRPSGCDYLWCCRRAISLSFKQNGPGHARHLVGQRHGRHPLALAGCEINQPRTQAGNRSVFCSSTVCAPCTKSFRKYLFPRLLVPAGFCLPPVRVFAGHHAQPGRKSAALLEGCTVANSCDCGRSRDRSNSESLQGACTVQGRRRCVRSACRFPRSARAGTASPSAVGSEVRAMHRTACCPRPPGFRERLLI